MRRCITLLVCLVLLCSAQRGWAENAVTETLCQQLKPGNQFFLGVFLGNESDASLLPSASLVESKPVAENLAGVYGGWVIMKHPYFQLEAEFGVYKHFRRDDFWEFTAAMVGRWTEFPWNHIIKTTFAIGFGMSYTDVIPQQIYEKAPPGTQLLSFIPYEFTFSLPDYPQWMLVARLHHRSDGWEIHNSAGYTGYNAMGFGLRYNF